MSAENPIRISPNNVIETTLWSDIYGDHIRTALTQGANPGDFTLIDRIALDAADRAVEFLRQRTGQAPAKPSGPITLEDDFEGEPQFG